MLLAIDTSAGTSVAVVDRDAGVLAELSTDDTRRHAEVIGPFIAQALQQADVTPQRLSAVAVGVGPGPFTGLRVGLAAARAFAFGAGKPVVHVISHDAIASTLTAPALVVTDARRRELYWSAYDGIDADGLPIRVDGPGLGKPDELPTGRERHDAHTVSAAALGLLAEATWAAGREFAGPEPLYLRSPDVTISAATTGGRRVTQ